MKVEWDSRENHNLILAAISSLIMEMKFPVGVTTYLGHKYLKPMETTLTILKICKSPHAFGFRVQEIGLRYSKLKAIVFV